MDKLPERSIIRKLMTILEIADPNQKVAPRILAKNIAGKHRIEFSYFKPAVGRRHKLGYSTETSIVSKVRFAIALELLDADCLRTVEKKDYSADQTAAVLFSERAKKLLSSSKVSLTVILQKSSVLLGKDPPQLPTAQRIYAECKSDAISYTRFRLCLSILLYEPDGALGASARRIYLPRSGEHQTPGEIGG